MYHPDHEVNSAVLTIINDGDGSQCGSSYAERCKLAEYGLLAFYGMATKVNPHMRHSKRRTVAEIAQRYYQNHVAECEAYK